MNPEQPQTPGQRWDPERYAANARFVADLGAPVTALLAPSLRDRAGRWSADYVRLRFAARRTG